MSSQRPTDSRALCDYLSRNACELAWEHMWRTPYDCSGWRVWIRPTITPGNPHDVVVAPTSPGDEWRSLLLIRVGGHQDLNQMHNVVRTALYWAPLYADSFAVGSPGNWDRETACAFDQDTVPKVSAHANGVV